MGSNNVKLGGTCKVPRDCIGSTGGVEMGTYCCDPKGNGQRICTDKTADWARTYWCPEEANCGRGGRKVRDFTNNDFTYVCQRPEDQVDGQLCRSDNECVTRGLDYYCCPSNDPNDLARNWDFGGFGVHRCRNKLPCSASGVTRKRIRYGPGGDFKREFNFDSAVCKERADLPGIETLFGRFPNNQPFPDNIPCTDDEIKLNFSRVFSKRGPNRYERE